MCPYYVGRISSATDGVVRNGKSTAGHQRYLCSHCR
ncbi:IS1 family transposase, partial [Escherichia coli]|nr:hypothetical protein [Escherichia coli]MDZ6763057.1 IS1 family transposase [Escherichia coli]